MRVKIPQYRYLFAGAIGGAVVAAAMVAYLIFGQTFYPYGQSKDFSQIVEEIIGARNLAFALAPTTKPQSGPAHTAVVNIVCDGGWSGAGGSGVIVESKGTILTNYHIIPQTGAGELVVTSCIVTIPDGATGKVNEIYQAEFVPAPELNEQDDLAVFQVVSPYIGPDGAKYGTDTPTFATINTCENRTPELGETVRVYGYPETGAGSYYLTITDGIVSALPNDGTISTSAFVTSGNSGGLAVDGQGCVLGMPSMVDWYTTGSLGVIKPVGELRAFLEQIRD